MKTLIHGIGVASNLAGRMKSAKFGKGHLVVRIPIHGSPGHGTVVGNTIRRGPPCAVLLVAHVHGAVVCTGGEEREDRVPDLSIESSPGATCLSEEDGDGDVVELRVDSVRLRCQEPGVGTIHPVRFYSENGVFVVKEVAFAGTNNVIGLADPERVSLGVVWIGGEFENQLRVEILDQSEVTAFVADYGLLPSPEFVYCKNTTLRAGPQLTEENNGC